MDASQEPYVHSNGRNVQSNPAGLFYEENGVLKSLHPGIELVINFGLIIGINQNGVVLPVYNNRHQMVAASAGDHNVHSLMSAKEARRLGLWRDISEHMPSASQSRNVGNGRKQNRRNRN